MRTLWHRVPLGLRVMLIVSICVLSFKPFIEWSYLLALWSGLTILLWYLGAFRLFRLVNLAYFTIVFLTLIYVLIFLYYYHRPLSEAKPFASNYPQFMMFLLAALIVTSGGVLLEEWIAIAKKIPVLGHPLCAIVISLSAGVGSSVAAVRRANQARLNSNPRSWYSPRTYPSECHFKQKLLDRIEVLYTTVVFMSGLLAADIRKWWRIGSKTGTSGGLKLMRLDDIYKVDSFPELYESVFANKDIATEWRDMLHQYVGPNQRVLDIGSGSGRLSFFLGSLNVAVDAIESNPLFVQVFQQRLNGNGKHPIRIFQDHFPAGLENQNPYELVVLHQNVMLELVNEMSLQELWKALSTVTAVNGLVIFDYPSRFHIPNSGQSIALLSDNFPRLGHVEYGYTYNGLQDGFHRARISLKRKTPEGILKSHEFNLRGIAPEVENLLDAAKPLGFALETMRETKAYTFFPSDLQIYVMRLM